MSCMRRKRENEHPCHDACCFQTPSVSAEFFHLRLVETMNEETVAQFRFKPCALRRHDFTCIGNRHQLIQGSRIHGESDRAFTGIYALFEFAKTANTTDEVDVLSGSRIFHVEERLQNELLEKRHVEAIDRAEILQVFLLEFASKPLATELHVYNILLRRMSLCRKFRNFEDFLQFFHELFRCTTVQIL